MYIPKPYFPNIPQVGNLDLDYIFIEDGYPILFTCINKKSIYLCICRTLCPKQKWVISETNIEILKMMVKREIPIKAAFKMMNGKSIIATWSKANPEESYIVFPTVNLSDSDLPRDSLYLNEDYAEDAMDYIDGLLAETRIQAMLEIESHLEHDNHSEDATDSAYSTYQTSSVSIAYRNIQGLDDFLQNQSVTAMDTSYKGSCVSNNFHQANALQADCENASKSGSDISLAA